MAKDCRFCAEDFFDREDRVYVTPSKNFGVVTTLSPDFDGQGMIVPKQHVRSCAYIPKENRIEFMDLQGAVVLALKEIYIGTPFLHEHGDAEGIEVFAQSVHHAHLCFRSVPSVEPMALINMRLDAIESMKRPGSSSEYFHSSMAYFPFSEIENRGYLRNNQFKHPGYLLCAQLTSNSQSVRLLKSHITSVPKEIPLGKGNQFPVYNFFKRFFEDLQKLLTGQEPIGWKEMEALEKENPDDPRVKAKNKRVRQITEDLSHRIEMNFIAAV